jgi:phosphoserine aminotransferase
MSRPWNFSAGPAILPEPVLQRVAASVHGLGEGGLALQHPERALSILEISHRSAAFEEIFANAIELCHAVIGIPRTHHVLFLQGGASLQFAMVPMNLRRTGRAAAYVETGVWSKRAIAESRLQGDTQVIASSADANFAYIPEVPEAQGWSQASYLHVTSNNTIYGTEWATLPTAPTGVPLVVDLSSNIASRPMPLERVDLGYAGAQKNLGPSGLTVVFVRKDLVELEPAAPVPVILRYKTHVDGEGMYNTPNTFAIVVLAAVLEWLRDLGGVEAMGQLNARKAGKLYALLDASELYAPHARPGSRSNMNVTWTVKGADAATSAALTKELVATAAAAGFNELKGHRSVGGCRASLYNAFPEAGVDALCQFLADFERRTLARS